MTANPFTAALTTLGRLRELLDATGSTAAVDLVELLGSQLLDAESAALKIKSVASPDLPGQNPPES
jgi:hypothetical protein